VGLTFFETARCRFPRKDYPRYCLADVAFTRCATGLTPGRLCDGLDGSNKSSTSGQCLWVLVRIQNRDSGYDRQRADK
jgi:hypothetical protein